MKMTMGAPESSFSIYLQRLRELPFVQDVRLAESSLELVTPSGTVRLETDLKRSHLRADAPQQLAHVHPDDTTSWILLAPHVGARVGAELEGLGINFMDRSGNCHLRVLSHVARIQGRREAPRRATRIKPSRAPGYQVLFALLADPELIHGSLRAIAKPAGVSRQAVTDAVARLHDEGYLRAHGSDRRWTSRPRGPLLERWVEGYQSAVRPGLVHGRFRLPVSGPEAVERHVEALGRDLVFGGTAGAHRLVGHYRGPHTVIHASPSEELRMALRASPTERGELVWLGPVGELGARGTSGSAHPLLVYAELLSDPDPRARELADRVAKKYLPWR